MKAELKTTLEKLKKLVPEKWSKDNGIGTEKECCILGCVNLAEGLGYETSIYGGASGLLAYPPQDDPIVVALAATVPESFVQWYDEDMESAYPGETAMWTKFQNLADQDKVITYNDESERTLEEIEQWVINAEAWLENNDKENTDV